MLRLFHAGLAAACFQMIAVVVTTCAVVLFAQPDINTLGPQVVNLATDCSSALLLPRLKWAYLIIALGVVLTSDHFVNVTAERNRRAWDSMQRMDRTYAQKALLPQLWFTSIGFAFLALRPPPDFLVALGYSFGCINAALITWPGIMSVASASFGANAEATRRALKI